MKSPQNKIIVVQYEDLQITESEIESEDNIKRRKRIFSLQSKNQTKQLFQQSRNLTPSSFVDILKAYKGKTDTGELDALETPQEVMARFYDEEKGVITDCKYATDTESGIRICAIEHIPEGYCLTVYDPVRDWFEIREFHYLLCVDKHNVKAYYLSNENEGSAEDSLQ